ncbi:hypothetical protein AMELA_G00285820 [Ameiurus melas]|uniref:Uncharacterized protein n=1 Tax=Ameiurus melas TaxID=219545 RepID=A0A7J5ZLN5_AMEME|nr:hypothetical protein AMELA_G00285820 [Ameiurus melas]
MGQRVGVALTLFSPALLHGCFPSISSAPGQVRSIIDVLEAVVYFGTSDHPDLTWKHRQSMMKKAVLMCFALFVVISVTYAEQCITQKQGWVNCYDAIDKKTYSKGATWVNSACQFCKCEYGTSICCAGIRDGSGQCQRV